MYFYRQNLTRGKKQNALSTEKQGHRKRPPSILLFWGCGFFFLCQKNFLPFAAAHTHFFRFDSISVIRGIAGKTIDPLGRETIYDREQSDKTHLPCSAAPV
ncbi:hypothetical protein H9X84_06565 [Anaerotignum lactatifermentans]|uniref:Uncharacterized protein n=1 Tax=Anaerotignum lactatifermentans TaxID=160404 RepID=A0ABS2G7K9_9FIRM|nr:hypothetical protein [Anaerotignum lactatifermentans]MBM6877464.1 hypothetical protein [Anaerotignum lactatifermentans]